MAGDTLWDIALDHGVTLEVLLAVNPQVTDRRVIHVGDKITVPPPGWQAPLAPVAYATIVDADLDGAGDLVVDGAVEVGFNHFYWAGELRGVYQFDLRGLPRDGPVALAHLVIRVNGTNTDGTDPHFTVFAGAGTGLPDKSDFTAGTLISALDAFASEGALCLDLTDTINRLRGDGADLITIVIRPNPLASTTAGTIGLSDSVNAKYGFQPARLALVTNGDMSAGVAFTELINNGSYSCEGGALAGYGAPGDGFVIIDTAMPRDLTAQVVLRGGLPNTTYTVQLIQSAGLGGSIEDCSVLDATLITDSRGNGHATVREARFPDTIGAFVYLVHLGDATGPVDLHGTRLVPVARDS